MKGSRTVDKATAVLVLGMHRSGTSALANTLQHLQVPLGAHLVAPWLDNPGGYFEHAGAVTVHETLLAALDRGWESLEPLPDGWLESPDALRAADALEALVREDFGSARLWAVKDPRLSRLLPLWHRVLAKLKIRPAHVFMLRHPDEVAGSLQRRDGIGADYAYLLWLQHYLEAERDSRGQDRALLTYDGLLEAPEAALEGVAKDLQIRWPKAPAQAALGDVLDPAQRHHVAEIEAPARGLRAAAHALYADAQAAQANGDQWPQGDSQRRLLDRWTSRLTPWVGGLGASLARQRRAGQAALQQCQAFDAALAQAQAISIERLADLQARDARIQRSEGVSLARLQEMEALGERLAKTDAALQATKAQSLDRLRELEALSGRLAETDVALQATEAQSLARLHETKSLGERVARTDAALQSTEAQSLQRLQQLEALGERLAKTDEALQATESQSLSRLQEMTSLGERLAHTDAALQATEAQSLSRLQELTSLGERLAQTDAALQATEAQSLARLQELEALAARLAETDEALQATEAQSLARLEDIESLARRVERTDTALAHAQRLSLERLELLQASDAALAQVQASALGYQRDVQMALSRLESVQAALEASQRQLEETRGQLQGSEANLQAMQASLAWRWSRPLRWFGRLLGRQGPGWSAT